MKKCFSIILAIFISINFCCLSVYSKDKLKGPLTLTIVPNERHQERETINFSKVYDPKLHFHVVLTNTSRAPQKLYNESCSFGFGKLSFEVVDEKGVKSTIKKKDMVVWEKNYPDWFTLNPNEQVVYDVYFLPDTWEGLPEFYHGQASKKIKIRAIYSFDDWTTYSPEYSFEIFRD
jgi:hypothetical protein